MELRFGGLSFDVGPQAAIAPRERTALASLVAPPAPQPSGGDPPLAPALSLTLVDRPPFPVADDVRREPAPAAVAAHGRLLRVQHALFVAELDPAAGTGVVWRREADGVALLITLRVALSAALPLHRGLPVHAAGLVLGSGRGLVCFGPSGAGKSTLAASARERGLHVLSDEQVSVLSAPARVAASGFWGALDGVSCRSAPLSALVELDRGPTFALARLDPAAALRRLLGVLLVPPQPGLWSVALALAGRFTHELPVYRLAWNPAEPPWEALESSLEAAERETCLA